MLACSLHMFLRVYFLNGRNVFSRYDLIFMLIYVILISDLIISEKGERNLLICVLCGNTEDIVEGFFCYSCKRFC